MNTFLHQRSFQKGFLLSLLLTGAFFAWEIGYIALPFLPVLPRPHPTNVEVYFTIALIALFSLNVGLFQYQKACGSCNIGAARASTLGGIVGAVALLCPVCLLLPISLLGVSISLVFLAPYIPLLQFIAIVLLVVSTGVLWPRT